MKHFAPRLAGLAALMWLTALLATPATAQQSEAEVGGIRLAGWKISPQVSASVGFETNVRRLENPSGAEADDVVWQAQASLNAARQGSRVRLQGGLLWDIRKYLRNASLDTFADVDAVGEAVINAEGNVDFQISDRFRHETRPLEVVNVGLLRRTSNTFTFATGIHPGGPLEGKPVVSWTYERFANDIALFAERHNTSLGGGARWAFYPRTQFALDAEVGRITYTESIRFEPGTPQAGQKINADSTYFKVLGGVTGKFTEKVSAQVKGGIGGASYDNGPSPGVTLAVESVLRWTPQPRSVVSVGYSRGIIDAYFTNFYVVDRVSASYKHTLRDRFNLAGTAAVARQKYSAPFSRTDTVLHLEPSMRTNLGRWFDLGLTYRFAQRLSSGDTNNALPGVDPGQDYISHAVFVGMSAKY